MRYLRLMSLLCLALACSSSPILGQAIPGITSQPQSQSAVSGSNVTFTGQDVGIVGNEWKIQDAADFNDDGKADILWRNTSGDLVMWQMNATTILSNTFITNVSTSWSIP